MSRVNDIQQKILQLGGGDFQKFFDAYLYKKYNFSNIQTFGVQAGTNKTTKGTPDSYVLTEDGKYILITCGSVSNDVEKKIESDIKSCFDKAKLNIEESKIKQIICGHISTNLSIEFQENIKSKMSNIKIDLIGIDTISHDLAFKYQSLAKEYFNIPINSNQLFNIDDFIFINDQTKINAPLNCQFLFRENELSKIKESVKNNSVTVIVGPSGIGKTRIALEACKYFETEGYNVICVKSNGNLLYDDIESQIEQHGKYLLLLDDANLVNSFEGVISYILNLKDNYEVKVLLTVRDYTRKQVVEILCKYVDPSFVMIDRFNDNDIHDILKANFGIMNIEFLDRITEISGGNIRVATLAAINLKKEENVALNNVEDVLKNYYGAIINEAKLSKEELILLCIIELAGRVEIGNNEFYKKMVDQNLNKNNAIELICNLYELELIDIFENEIVSISEQIFGDYILYYVICYKKWLRISDIVKDYFPKNKNRIVYAINTLLSKFQTKEIISFVSEQIKTAWDESEDSDELYIESFYYIDPIRSLSLLKSKIDKCEVRKIIVTQELIDAKKNYEIINSKEIEILSNYKYLECFDEAFELMLNYFEKRNDLFMDFYFAIIRNLLYDKNSYYYNYEKEANILSTLWGKCRNGEEYYYSLLYINVVECALNIEYDYKYQAINHNSITIYRIPIVLTEEMKKIRAEIWKNLFTLKKNNKFAEKINNILTKQYLGGIDEKSLKDIVKLDFDCIYQHLPKKIDYVSAKIINMYKRMAEQLNIVVDNRMQRSEENKYFKFYRVLHNEYDPAISIEENNVRLKNAIMLKIENYVDNDFNKLFKACKYMFIHDKETIIDLENGILVLFQILKQNQEKFLMALNELFKQDLHLSLFVIKNIMQHLLSMMGYAGTKNMIYNYKSDFQMAWLLCMWEMLPEVDITEKIAQEFTKFLKGCGDRYVPSIFVVYKYYKYDRELFNYLISACDNNRIACENFLKTCDDNEEMTKLLEIFKGKESELYKIYIKTFGLHVDINGKLFMILYKFYPNIWNEYIDYLKESDTGFYYKVESIIEKMWDVPEFVEKMQYAFDILLERKGFSNERLITILIGKKNGTKNEKKKKMWLLNELKNPKNDIIRFNKLINSVAVAYIGWEIEYILEFIKINKSIGDFEKIDLFPLTKSWVGSEIPLINGEIKFLETLKDRINGLDYIEHKKYLNDKIKCSKKRKHDVEIWEYANNIL